MRLQCSRYVTPFERSGVATPEPQGELPVVRSETELLGELVIKIALTYPELTAGSACRPLSPGELPVVRSETELLGELVIKIALTYPELTAGFACIARADGRDCAIVARDF